LVHGVSTTSSPQTSWEKALRSFQTDLTRHFHAAAQTNAVINI
jgi:hypothetical protein